MRNPAIEEGAPSAATRINSEDASVGCKAPRASESHVGKAYKYLLAGSYMMEAQREH